MIAAVLAVRVRLAKCPNSGAPQGKLAGAIVLALGAAVVAVGVAFALFVDDHALEVPARH
jgi:hypothetical protein